MAREGRIMGRVSRDGTSYDLWQFGAVRQSIPIAEAHASDRLRRAIQQNKWEALS